MGAKNSTHTTHNFDVMDEIQKLWREHLAAPFPRQVTDEFIGDYDAVMLDADIAGCVSSFLDAEGKLDEVRILVLQKCQRVLAENISLLDTYCQQYYGRLQRLCELVLFELSR